MSSHRLLRRSKSNLLEPGAITQNPEFRIPHFEPRYPDGVLEISLYILCGPADDIKKIQP